jgi:hypothetical protein
MDSIYLISPDAALVRYSRKGTKIPSDIAKHYQNVLSSIINFQITAFPE